MGSSNGNDITGRYLKIVAAGIGVWAVPVVLDGDLVALDLVAGTRPVG
jgi:ATP-dependent DNA ligase